MCIFCNIANKEIPSNIIYENEKVLAILDIHPICDGHCLIIPKKHIEDIYAVDDDILLEMYNVAKKINNLLEEKMNTTGCSFSINYGDKQDIKHIHLHVMPNFNKKASKSVEDVYKLLTE